VIPRTGLCGPAALQSQLPRLAAMLLITAQFFRSAVSPVQAPAREVRPQRAYWCDPEESLVHAQEMNLCCDAVPGGLAYSSFGTACSLQHIAKGRRVEKFLLSCVSGMMLEHVAITDDMRPPLSRPPAPAL